jgi:hypothetical protein
MHFTNYDSPPVSLQRSKQHEPLLLGELRQKEAPMEQVVARPFELQRQRPVRKFLLMHMTQILNIIISPYTDMKIEKKMGQILEADTEGSHVQV